MTPAQRERVVKLCKLLAGEEEYRWLDRIQVRDRGFGYDIFGMEKETAALAFLFARLIYRHWFRVESEGHHHIPRVGRCIVAANHGGMLPWDAAMACIDDAIASGAEPQALGELLGRVQKALGPAYDHYHTLMQNGR